MHLAKKIEWLIYSEVTYSHFWYIKESGCVEVEGRLLLVRCLLVMFDESRIQSLNPTWDNSMIFWVVLVCLIWGLW